MLSLKFLTALADRGLNIIKHPQADFEKQFLIQGFTGKYEGYSLSVISTPFSYGGSEGLWEIAVLDKNNNLCYNTELTDDVIGYLKEEDLLELVDDFISYSQEKSQESLDEIISTNTNSTFLDALKKNEPSVDLTFTDNGALAYATSGDSFVDFDFATSTFRGKNEEEIYDEFVKIFLQNKELAMRQLFFLGDIREGKGERHAFKSIMKHLALNYTDVARAVLKLIPEYGRWDEVVDLLNTPLHNDVIKMLRDQIKEDLNNADEGKEISLCAKWLPSINASSKDTTKKALVISEAFGMNKKEYRKMLSFLRDKLNIIEKALAEKNIEKLSDMQEVLSSKQNFKYSKAVMRLMPEERKEFFEKVKRGEATINVDVLEPHEIYGRYRREHMGWHGCDLDESYEMLWSMLPNKVIDANNVLVVRDGSGSMTTPIPGTNHFQVLDVASALSIYFSEHQEGGFKDKFITFSSRPKLVDLSGCDTLAEKMALLSRYTEIDSTDIEKTFDLILKTAVKNDMKQEELPKSLLIVSDMQFDLAHSGNYDETLFETIKNKYKEAGYEIPRLIFWNVNISKITVPEVDNDRGLVLLGGFSKNTIDMIAENNFEKEIVNEEGEKETVQLTPFEVLFNKLSSERYNPVSEALKDVLHLNNKQVPLMQQHEIR